VPRSHAMFMGRVSKKVMKQWCSSVEDLASMPRVKDKEVRLAFRRRHWPTVVAIGTHGKFIVCLQREA